MPDRFQWRSSGYDDADAADDRLLASHVNGAAEVRPQQPFGELLPALKNQAAQADQRADAQRRRAARAEARLSQLRADVSWIVLGMSIVAFGVGFAVAWSIIRRGGGL